MTIYVIEIIEGVVEQIQAFADTDDEYELAVALFKKLISENGGTQDDIDNAIEDGIYVTMEYTVQMKFV